MRDFFITAVSPDIIEMTRLEALECGASHDEEACGDGESDGGGDSPQLSPLGGLRRSIPASEHGGDGEISQLTINVSTLSAPEVSLMPSPEVSKVGFFFFFLNYSYKRIDYSLVTSAHSFA